jgi:hypothetical protein
MSCIYLQNLQEQKQKEIMEIYDEIEKLYKEIAKTNYELAKHIKYCHHPNAANNTQEVFQHEKE